MSTDSRRVLVALSGGVDSSVCVHLLRQDGFEVEAVVLDLSPAHATTVEAARETAGLLGVTLHVVRDYATFEQSVVEPFCSEYRAGRTPNPCILCNPTTKFRLLLHEAQRLGFPHIATGHYASVRAVQASPGDRRWLLSRADFIPRDQSYMLYRLGQEVLSRLLLPLQNRAKDEVRRIADEAGLPCAKRPDSQEICFIPDNDYPAYIEARGGALPEGDFIAPDGRPCGRHRGILHYTVGQRKGLGVALGRPVFVSRIDAAENRVYLANAGDEYAPGVLLGSCVLQRHPLLDGLTPGSELRCAVKIRSMAQPVPATVALLSPECAEVRFDEPQRAPAPGQSVVWYHGDDVLGGGLIEAPLANARV